MYTLYHVLFPGGDIIGKGFESAVVVLFQLCKTSPHKGHTKFAIKKFSIFTLMEAYIASLSQLNKKLSKTFVEERNLSVKIELVCSNIP